MNSLEKINNSILKFISYAIELNGWLLFILFCLTLWLLSFVKSEFVVSEQLFNKYMDERMQEKYDSNYNELTSEFEDDLDDTGDTDKFFDSFIDFGLIVLLNTFQFLIISIVIYVGLIFINIQNEISYSSIFKIVMIGEFIFFLPKAINYLWFLTIKENYSFEDVRDFDPYSLYNLLKDYGIVSWMAYPLKFINLFEFIYICFITIGIGVASKVKTSKVWMPVVSSYLSLIFLWMVIKIYLSTIL